LLRLDEEIADPEVADVQANLELPDFGAGVGAQAWHEIHPLNREQLIEQHPELVGPAVGLPSDARDRANRLLLARNRAALLARQQRLEEQHDGAASRATMDTERGLADIAAIERRLAAEPGSRLMSYPPAVLAEGDPKWDNYVPPVKLRK
jgi:hypothetical protein